MGRTGDLPVDWKIGKEKEAWMIQASFIVCMGSFLRDRLPSVTQRR